MGRAKRRRSASATGVPGKPTSSPKAGSTAAEMSDGCPTSVFDGEVILNDSAARAFLRVVNSTYLLMLDPECLGTYVEARVVEAYQKYRADPGQGGRLRCDGFLAPAGGAQVLHVVR